MGRLVYSLDDVASALNASLLLLLVQGVDHGLRRCCRYRGEYHENVAALLQQGNHTLHERMLLEASLHSAADRVVNGRSGWLGSPRGSLHVMRSS